MALEIQAGLALSQASNCEYASLGFRDVNFGLKFCNNFHVASTKTKRQMSLHVSGFSKLLDFNQPIEDANLSIHQQSSCQRR